MVFANYVNREKYLSMAFAIFNIAKHIKPNALNAKWDLY